MKTAIVTGFERFGNYLLNPTAVLASEVNGKIISGHQITAFVLPTHSLFPKIDWGKILVGEAVAKDASAIISFGLASESWGFEIDLFGINWAENKKYLLKEENKKPLDPMRKKKEKLTTDLNFWDLGRMEKELRRNLIYFKERGINDISHYCCNALIYRTLRAMEKFGVKIPFIFIHVPCTKKCLPPLPPKQRTVRRTKVIIEQEKIKKGLEIVLGCYKNGKEI